MAITIIRCGSCEAVMAAFHDEDEAHETAAYVTGSYERESGEYECEACGDVRFTEGVAMAAAYDREQALRAMMEDDAAWRDEYLARADLAFDAARDRGEV